MKSYEAIGVVEAQNFTTALELVDEMCKTSHVQFLGAEKYLGGRLVTVIVGGSIANVTAAVEAARAVCDKKPKNPLKMSLVIPKPHAEILKFIIPSQAEAEVMKVTVPQVQETEAEHKIEAQETPVKETVPSPSNNAKKRKNKNATTK